MTVRELIDQLSDMPDDAAVIIRTRYDFRVMDDTPVAVVSDQKIVTIVGERASQDVR